MAGLLGAVLGGAAKGYAESRVKSIEAQEAFNMKQALLDAEMDKQLRLKEAGIKLEQEAVDRERGKIKGLMDSAYKDPDAGKGGYESEDSKAAKMRAKLEAQSAALMQNGYMDQAKALQSELARLDKSEMSAAQLEYKLAQLEANQQRYDKDRELKSSVEDAKNSARLAQIEAAGERAAAKAGKKTETQTLYEAYKERVMTEGAPDGKGGTSKKPFTYDKWYTDVYLPKTRKNDDSDKISETVELDEENNVLSKKRTTTSKVKEDTKPIRKYVPGKGLV